VKGTTYFAKEPHIGEESTFVKRMWGSAGAGALVQQENVLKTSEAGRFKWLTSSYQRL
jgi:hypothetical protein